VLILVTNHCLNITMTDKLDQYCDWWWTVTCGCADTAYVGKVRIFPHRHPHSTTSWPHHHAHRTAPYSEVVTVPLLMTHWCRGKSHRMIHSQSSALCDTCRSRESPTWKWLTRAAQFRWRHETPLQRIKTQTQTLSLNVCRPPSTLPAVYCPDSVIHVHFHQPTATRRHSASNTSTHRHVNNARNAFWIIVLQQMFETKKIRKLKCSIFRRFHRRFKPSKIRRFRQP